MARKCILIVAILLYIAMQAIGLNVGSRQLEEEITHPPEVAAKNVTAHICPFLCMIGNETTCVPPPCPLPPCVDHKPLRPLDCCEVCPNGPNCQGPDGHIIKWNHWEIVDGKNCTCKQPLSPATCT